MGVVALLSLRWGTLGILCLSPFVATAHEAEVNASWSFTFEPWVVFCLMLSIGLYGLGLTRLKSNAGWLIRRAIAFCTGWLILAIALVSPLDTLGSKLFSAHMMQHELMMIAAAPLLVLGRPFGVWLWALPERWRRPVAEIFRHPVILRPWALLSSSLGAWLCHAAALWLWHVPQFFQAALANNGIHAWQHLSFLVSALFFWWAVLGQASRGTALACLFTTMLHTGALGVLLTFSATPWYSAYAATTLAFGLTPLEDQQLGGLIMWVPGGLVYVVAALGLMGRYFGLSERRLDLQSPRPESNNYPLSPRGRESG